MNLIQLSFRFLPRAEEPENAKLILSNNSKSYLISSLESGVYKFNIPPQKKDLSAKLTVGDYRNTFSLQTVNRPRLETLSSLINFPEYLSINSQNFDSLNNQIEIRKILITYYAKQIEGLINLFCLIQKPN